MHSEHNGGAPLVRLDGAGVVRGEARLLADIGFSLRAGERWALLGDNGAGKTTLLRLLRGDIPPTEGLRRYELPGAGGPQDSPLGLRQRLAVVSGDMQDLYARNGWAATGLEAVLAGFFDSALLYAAPSPKQCARARETLDSLGLSDLAEARVARMSAGQARAVLLARALACRPDALLLDECLEGLDARARAEFLAALDRAAGADPRLAMVFTSHRAAEADELPRCLTHAAEMAEGRLASAGPLDAMRRAPSQACHAPSRSGPAPRDEGPRPAPGLLEALVPPAGDVPPRGFLARISGADLVVGGRRLLHGIDWTILPGEHWAVLGANGAGKSTLLSLLAGETWPSALDGAPGRVEYGFARPGEPLDEARRRIGRVGAALDRDHDREMLAEEAVWSGGFGSVGLYAEAGPGLRARARELMEFFGVAELTERRLGTLSRGQLRRTLLARALAGRPALLLLDEPMAGLDARTRRAARELFARLARQGLPLVMVTHHLRDLPDEVGRVLRLKAGRVEFCGDRGEYEAKRAARRSGPPEK